MMVIESFLSIYSIKLNRYKLPVSITAEVVFSRKEKKVIVRLRFGYISARAVSSPNDE